MEDPQHPTMSRESGSDGRSRSLSTERGVLLVVVLLAAGATLLATSRYGIAMTSDSVEYRGRALSLANGLGYTDAGSASTIFPPGYSAVLSIGERLGLDPVDGARLVSVVAFVGTTLLGFVLLRRHVRSPAVVMGGTVVIGCSAVLLWVFQKAWSEHLFIVVVLLLVLVAEDLVVRARSIRLLAAAAVLVWAGFYLRYAGIVLVPFMAVVVLVTAWPVGRRAALARTVGFLALSLSAPALWMIRNVQAGRGPMGVRRDAAATLPDNVERTVLTLSGWISFQGPTSVRVAALLGVLGLAVALAVLIRPARSQMARGARELWPLALFVVLYVVYLIGTASVAAFAPIYTRYLIPVYVPLVVLGAWAFDRARGHLGDRGSVVMAAGALAWIAASVFWFGARALEARQNGAGGYASPEWRQSALMEDVKRWDQPIPLVSNDVAGIELLAGRHVAESVPRTFVGSNEPAGALPAFVERVRCAGHIALVWFDRSGTRTRLYSPEELAEHVTVTPIVEHPDGTIYDLTPLASGTATAPCAR